MTKSPQIYDEIGANYNRMRLPDARIASALFAALGDAQSIVNVGAGTGAYEPRSRRVIAVEPSGEMILQRESPAGSVLRASAPNLPLVSDSFDAALAILTVHHWPDRLQGLREMKRVAPSLQVMLTWDPSATGFWLVDEYFPELLSIDRDIFPTLEEIESVWGELEVSALPIPRDCTDGFLGAYWRRPEAYLEAEVRASISTFTKLHDVEAGLSRLEADLSDGSWQRRHGELLSKDELDIGYRILRAGHRA